MIKNRAASLLFGLSCLLMPGEGAIAESSAGHNAPIKVISEGFYDGDYTVFLQGDDPLSITDFTREGTRRGVVELVILQQALHLGGLKNKVVIVSSPNYERMLHLIKSGTYVMGGNTVWRENVEHDLGNLVLTQPTVKNGEYEAGIYTVPENTKALAAKNLEDLRAFAFVSNKQWRVDWRTLSGLGLKRLYNVATWDAVTRMVIEQRADYFMAPFSEKDDLSIGESFTLVPVPGLKVALQGSRHFVLSSAHPDFQKVNAALTRGLKILRAQGRIKKALTETGLFNAKTKDWKLIN
jgi:hypothetical protein